MRFVDNANPKDERKLSKCSDPNCKYVGSIMRESEDGKRWCAIHGEGKPDSEAKPPRKKAEYTCKGCGFPVAYEGDYCGECICEEDGL